MRWRRPPGAGGSGWAAAGWESAAGSCSCAASSTWRAGSGTRPGTRSLSTHLLSTQIRSALLGYIMKIGIFPEKPMRVHVENHVNGLTD